MNTPTVTHTIVVEFPASESPRYHAGMQVLGGTVVAVAFDGNRLDVEMELLAALQEILPGAEAMGWNVEKAHAAIKKATA